ncbi:SCAN domain-containing protein 3-like [Mercenaria mercenaria]|uniref:SCAN domain-containing protein 3-like n=1 Tax=Mercenaria mercenaria TaxID=6596 RepID=UPI00234ED8B6|nr:SCAN domain-containing protein 3-like [Mercenaria mercenaria]
MSQQTLNGFGFFKSSSGVKRALESDSETVESPKKKFIKNLNQDSFEWYVADENGVWHCSVCRECKLDNAYARGHSKPGKTTNHTRHADSNQHKASVTRLKYKGKESLPKQVDNILTKEADSITSYMKCAYHQAKHELPKSAFKELIDLADNLNVELIKDKSCEPLYTSNYSLNEFHQSISDVIWEGKYEAIIRSQKYGLIIDESTDIGNKKQLLAYIQYLDEDGVKCALLENMLITTSHANAETITCKIKDCLERKQIDISKMVGIGTDGASVMTGSKNGVVKRLKDFAPSLIGVHCAAHRCSLATSQATKSIPELESYSRTVTNIFYYFSNSALRSNKLSEIQSLLNLPSLKFANIHSVRWLSLQNAVEVLYRSYPALVVALEHEAVTNSVAKGLLNEVV